MVQVPAEVLEKGAHKDMPLSQVSSFVHAEHLDRRAAWDDLMEDVARRAKALEQSEVDPGRVLEDGVPVSGTATLVEVGESPTWMPVIPEWETYHRDPNFHTEEDMRAAVKEEIRLCNEETDKLEAFFSSRFARLVHGTEVDEGLLASNAEAWRDADMWWVQDSYVVRSCLNKRVEDFDYGGLFVPVPALVRSVTGVTTSAYLRPVVEETWTGVDPVTRLETTRSHWKLDGATYTGWAMCNRELAVFNGRQVVAGLEVALRCSFSFETGAYQGGPGAGKTTQIVSQHKVGDFVMSPLVMSVKDTRAKLVKEKKCTLAVAKQVCRTNDSLLVAVGRAGRIPVGFPRAELVRSDEVYNGRLGRTYACCALLGAKRVIGFGDFRQIPPVVRADTVPLYVQFKPEHVVKRFVVFRGAAAILACFNEHYGGELRTLSTAEGVVTLLKATEGLVPSGDYLLLCMNQVHKKTLHTLFPSAKHRVKTTHEAQGGEADFIYLFCFDLYKRARDDEFHLYNVAAYVNVAISRARKGFFYVNLSPNRDCVTEWVEVGKDPVAVTRARYLKSG